MRTWPPIFYLTDIKVDLANNGIEKIGLFGSFAKEKDDLYSDIDIAIKTTPKFVKRFDGVQGFLFLEDLRKNLEKKFHRHVDICDEAGLKYKNIIEGVIYA